MVLSGSIDLEARPTMRLAELTCVSDDQVSLLDTVLYAVLELEQLDLNPFRVRLRPIPRGPGVWEARVAVLDDQSAVPVARQGRQRGRREDRLDERGELG